MPSTRSHTDGGDRRRTASACVAAALLVAGAVASSQPSEPSRPGRTEDSAVARHPLGAVQPPRAPEPVIASPLPPGELPVPVAPRVQLVAASRSGSSGSPSGSATGIPATALAAYTNAASVLARRDSSCGLPWSILAGIGRVESNHGRFGGATLSADGYPSPPIRGIPLDGRPGVALIRATDGGTWTGDPVFERAVGPMQFLPSTWRAVAADGNGDGAADPNNIYDAALGAGDYLCSGGGDLRAAAGARAAVFRYNHSESYVDTVLALARDYEHGIAAQLPDNPVGNVPEPGQVHDLPPASVTVVDPEPPAAAVLPPSTPAPAPLQPKPADSPRPSPGDRPAVPSSANHHTAGRPTTGATVAASPASSAGKQLSQDIQSTVHAAICEMTANLPRPEHEAIGQISVAALRQHGLKLVKPAAAAPCRAEGPPPSPQLNGAAAASPGEPAERRQGADVSKTEE
ncbi:lytic murein transglycosylase [Amycolatopsis sp. NPDC054798]